MLFISFGIVLLAAFTYVWFRNSATDAGSRIAVPTPPPSLLTGTSSSTAAPEQVIVDTEGDLTASSLEPAELVPQLPQVREVPDAASLPQRAPDRSIPPQQFTYFARYNSPLYKSASSAADRYGFLPRNSEVILTAPPSAADEFTQVTFQAQNEAADGFLLTESLSEERILPLVSVPRDQLAEAVVQIRCPLRGDFGNGVYGSGVVITAGGKILTAAHIIEAPVDAAATTCEVFLPLKNEQTGVWQARALYQASIVDKQQTIEDYQATGRDIAYLQIISPENDAAPRAYPYVPYAFCNAKILNDTMVSIGFAQDISLDALSFFDGEILQFADIKTIVPLSFKHSYDISRSHPYAFAKIKNLSGGASGGLAFDTDQNCIVGVHSRVGLSRDQTTALEYIAIP